MTKQLASLVCFCYEIENTSQNGVKADLETME